MERKQLLIADRSGRFSREATEYLGTRGYCTTSVETGAAALSAARSNDFHAFLIELRLSPMSGLELCSRLIAVSRSPVVFVSSDPSPLERMAGLAAGASDFLSKPVFFPELEWRLALLTRSDDSRSRSILLGPQAIRLDLVARVAVVAGKPLPLTQVELAALELLLRQRGEVVPEAALRESLLGGSASVADIHVPDVIESLRRALESAGAGSVITTFPGLGHVVR